MKKTISLLVLLTLLSSCSLTSKSEPEAVQYLPPSAPTEVDESIIEACFTESDLPWEVRTLVKVRAARQAIAEEEGYLKSQVVNGTIPGGTYVEGVKRLAYQYNKFRDALDDRIALEGSVTPACKRLYELESEMIVNDLNNQLANISEGLKGDEDTISKLKATYEMLRPFIKMAGNGGLKAMTGGLL